MIDDKKAGAGYAAVEAMKNLTEQIERTVSEPDNLPDNMDVVIRFHSAELREALYRLEDAYCGDGEDESDDMPAHSSKALQRIIKAYADNNSVSKIMTDVLFASSKLTAWLSHALDYLHSNRGDFNAIVTGIENAAADMRVAEMVMDEVLRLSDEPIKKKIAALAAGMSEADNA